MAVDIKNLDVNELAKLQTDIETTLAQKKEEKRQTVIAKVRQLLADNEMSFDDLPGRTAIPRAKPRPKYRNPKDYTQTWSGRGRKPAWIEENLKEGVALEKMRIS